MKRILILIILAATIFTTQAQLQKFIVGTYNAPSSKGIFMYEFNSTNGTAKKISEFKIDNPSFLAITKNKKIVYAVNETSSGNLTSFSLLKDSLVLINAAVANGNSTCHVALSNNNKWAAVSNYSSGNISLYALNKNGYLQPSTHTVTHTGIGLDTSRQKSPHVHSAYFSNNSKTLYVADLGVDKVFIYNINEKLKKLEPNFIPHINTPAGSGPRHFIFSKKEKYLYVLAEMTGKIFSFKNEGNQVFKTLQTISTLPVGDSTHTAGSADIHISPDGQFLYASNRGIYNNIIIYRINKNNGLLSLVGFQSTLGSSPRNFIIHPSGNFLLAANQKSDEIIIFSINKFSGLLTDTGNKISVGKPVCIKWF